MGHTPTLTDTWNFPARLLHSNGYKEYFNPDNKQQGQVVRLQGVGLELLGGCKNTVVSFNTRRAASRPTRSSEGGPSRAMRHPSCPKHSSQPLSDDKNILDYVLWTDGNPTTIRYRPDRKQCSRIILGGSSSHSSIVSDSSGHSPIQGKRQIAL
jgi:hypothetical protein